MVISCAQATGGFLPFLPQDAASDGGDPASEEVVSLISDDLAALLRAGTPDFWAALETDASLRACLDSYLQHCRRPYDSRHGSGGVSAARQLLHRRVLLVLLRIAQTAAEDSGQAARRTTAVRKLQLLNLPKLLDVCSLYGADNPQLVQRLVAQALAAVPQLADGLSALGRKSAENLHSVCDMCVANLVQLEDPGAGPELAAQLADGVQYVKDVCLTLAAFLAALPAAADPLLGPEAGLVSAVAAVHDELAPQTQTALTRAAHVDRQTVGEMRRLLGHVTIASEHVTMLMLQHAYLAAPQQLSKQTPTASPAERGERLMSVVITLGQASPSAPTNGSGQAGLLAALVRRRRLPGVISGAAQAGVLQLDDAQRDYLHALLGEPLSDGTGSASGAAASSSVALGDGMDAAVVASSISQIKELLPDYGDGFLLACLRALDFDATQVINRLLEGSLPPSVASLDPQLPMAAAEPTSASLPSSSAGGLPANGISAATAGVGTLDLNGLSWSGLRDAAAASDTTTAGARARFDSRPAQQAPATRAHRATTRLLSNLGDEREAVLRAARETQWEYDDEYDDSFDAMAGATADGLADVEGEDQEPRRQPGGGGVGGVASGKTRLWIHAGRVYNYNPKKPDTIEVRSQAEADTALRAATDAATNQIHGLGRGGNVPDAAVPPRQRGGQPGRGGQQHGHAGRGQVDDRGDADDGARAPAGGDAHHGGPVGEGVGPPQNEGGQPGHGRGRGRGREGGRGAVAPQQRDRLWKDQHKSSVGNHNRKDKAAKKAGML